MIEIYYVLTENLLNCTSDLSHTMFGDLLNQT